MPAILNSTILDSAILHKKTSLIHSDSIWWWQSWILKCWIQPLPSWWFRHLVIFSQILQKHSHSTLTLTQTNSIWLKLIHSHLTWWYGSHLEFCHSWIQPFCTKKLLFIHSHSTWWWQPFWILLCWIQTLPSWIQPFCTKLWLKLIQSDSNSFILTQLDDVSHLEFCHSSSQPFWTKKTSLIHSDSTWWWIHLWILLSWIQPFCTKLWLKLIQSDSNSFILTQLDDVSHLEFCLLLVSHFEQKKTSLIHSDSTWWWQPSWILPSWIWPSWIQPFCTKLWLKLIQSDSNSFILTQLDDVSHLEFCLLLVSHFEQKKNFTHSFWLNLMMAAILNSTILDSAILHKQSFTHSFWLILMMAAILNSTILDSAILNKKNCQSFILDSTW